MRSQDWFAAMALLCFASGNAFAQSISERDTLQQTWKDKQYTHRNLYETTPVTHIVPSFNTITYAARGEKIDADVQSDDEDRYQSPELKLSGYTVAPHMAVSLKNIGLGFSGEAGQRRAVFTETNGRQESYLDYRGLGLYIYWIVPQPIHMLVPSVTVGYSSYSTKHNVSLLENGSKSDNSATMKAFSYSVSHYEAGLNLGMKLLKNFTFTPWVHLDSIDTKDGSKQVDSAKTYYSSYSAILEKDLDLFWHSSNPIKYGIDLSVRMFDQLEFHLGGVLGLVAASSFNTSSVTDKSVSLGVSFDQKGN